MRYSISRLAEKDIFEIAHYLEEYNPFILEKWIRDLKKTFELLSTQPFIGVIRTNLTKLPVRIFPVKNYVIIYQTRKQEVEIKRVFHSARDLLSLLEHDDTKD